MQLALETLGYPTYHMTSMIRNPPDGDMWLEAHNAKFFHAPGSPTLDRMFWDKILGHVSATTDLPCAAFFEELIAAYPGIKCVLVERDEDAWYQSWYDVQIRHYDNWALKVVARLDPQHIGKMLTVASRCVIEGFVGAKSRRELEERSRPVYRAHNQAVKEKVPEGQLLLYQLGSGWEPLCEFLGKPVPDVPFPRVNETEMVNEYVGEMIMVGVRNAVMRFLVYVAVAFAITSAVVWTMRLAR
jgi:hypothetical protein